MYWLREEGLIEALKNPAKDVHLTRFFSKEGELEFKSAYTSGISNDLIYHLASCLRERWEAECKPIQLKIYMRFVEELKKQGIHDAKVIENTNRQYFNHFLDLSGGSFVLDHTVGLLDLKLKFAGEQIFLSNYGQQKQILAKEFSQKERLNKIYKAYWATKNALKSDFESYWNLKRLKR